MSKYIIIERGFPVEASNLHYKNTTLYSLGLHRELSNRVLVLLKRLYLLYIKESGQIVRLALLKAKPKTLVAIVLFICLILVILDANKVQG